MKNLIKTLKKLPIRSKTYQKIIKQSTIELDKLSMTPHRYFITQKNNMEKPFTGKLWDCVDTGHYECSTCTNPIFE